MNLVKVMRWSNGLLAISALVEIVTGLMLFFDAEYIGPVDTIDVHKYNGLIFIVLVAIHFWLNWPWFRTQFFHRRPVNRLSQKRPQ